MDVLEKVFGSKHKVKIMRLFLFNQNSAFDAKEVSKRTKVPLERARREILTLKKMGLIKDKTFVQEKVIKKKTKRKRVKGWILNEKFHYLLPLQNFLIHISASQQEKIVEKIRKVGSVKLLIISGVFIREWESRADILIVGDKLKQNIVSSVISDIESEIGKEINYCSFDTKDFLYRIGVCDKLVRDILDYPHKKVIDKLELA